LQQTLQQRRVVLLLQIKMLLTAISDTDDYDDNTDILHCENEECEEICEMKFLNCNNINSIIWPTRFGNSQNIHSESEESDEFSE